MDIPEIISLTIGVATVSAGAVGFLFKNWMNAIVKNNELEISSTKSELGKIYSEVHDMKNKFVTFMSREEYIERRKEDQISLKSLEERFMESVREMRSDLKAMSADFNRTIKEALDK